MGFSRWHWRLRKDFQFAVAGAEAVGSPGKGTPGLARIGSAQTSCLGTSPGLEFPQCWRYLPAPPDPEGRSRKEDIYCPAMGGASNRFQKVRTAWWRPGLTCIQEVGKEETVLLSHLQVKGELERSIQIKCPLSVKALGFCLETSPLEARRPAEPGTVWPASIHAPHVLSGPGGRCDTWERLGVGRCSPHPRAQEGGAAPASSKPEEET